MSNEDWSIAHCVGVFEMTDATQSVDTQLWLAKKYCTGCPMLIPCREQIAADEHWVIRGGLVRAAYGGKIRHCRECGIELPPRVGRGGRPPIYCETHADVRLRKPSPGTSLVIGTERVSIPREEKS